MSALQQQAIHEVRVSGGVFAGLLHDAACSENDMEGLLFGRQIDIDEASVGDNHVQRVHQKSLLVVQSYLPTGAPLSFYGADGRLNKTKFKGLVKTKDSELVGWFKFRRNSTLSPSLREAVVHEQLVASRDCLQPLVFAMLNASFAPNNARHTYDYCFSYQNPTTRLFQNLQMSLMNLDQSVHDGYRGLVAANASILKDPDSARPDTFGDAVRDLLMSCQHDTEQQYTKESKAVENAYQNTIENMSRLAKEVAQSDAEVFALREELAQLKGQVPPPRPVSSPKRVSSGVAARVT